MSDVNSFIDDIERFIESGKLTLPVFNPTAMRVQQELVKKEPDMGVVEKLIIRDQTLASEVLKLANSAFYRGLVEVRTVKAAMIRLGMREVGKIVLLAASKTQFRIVDKELSLMLKKIWQHSAGNALAANWLARRCEFTELAGQAFFSGLFHDIGKLFLLVAVEQAKLRTSGKMTNALLLEVINTLHTRQGYSLMQHWNMPEEYCVVVRDHHEPNVDAKNTLLIIVRLADMACHKLGIGMCSLTDINLAATPEANLLEITEIDLAELEIMLEDTTALTR
ncbi:HDOD domain-containing protein [Desulfopila aestuarii]|uniref:HD-like signal output (HDOD) domain, no enzymatic activity n=1 Tax=Desulfopila aestuarii DSM 18488 TaxID=1121416 RepID=A0A1M7Y883_9BACT|nr:HDOD domain-containing protein [Desulfopila aestuarii]SHO48842.1 HD-like signal output (HDOD) domain, no enzymatic activity [Desulfopila aestuarii DSM 18488]